MTEKLKAITEEELAKLPKEAQEAIDNFDWVKVTEEIGEEYLLTESELNDFQVETLLVLVSLTNPQFLAVNIENHVEMTTDDSEKMAQEVYEKILTPIGSAIAESVKKSISNKKPNPEQTLNFILSGGDYSAFVDERKDVQQEETPRVDDGSGIPVTTPTLADIKANMEKNKLVI